MYGIKVSVDALHFTTVFFKTEDTTVKKLLLLHVYLEIWAVSFDPCFRYNNTTFSVKDNIEFKKVTYVTRFSNIIAALFIFYNFLKTSKEWLGDNILRCKLINNIFILNTMKFCTCLYIIKDSSLAVHMQLILYLTKVRNSFIENEEKIY